MTFIFFSFAIPRAERGPFYLCRDLWAVISDISACGVNDCQILRPPVSGYHDDIFYLLYIVDFGGVFCSRPTFFVKKNKKKIIK